MNGYTVSFFGHREVEKPAKLESLLDDLLHDIIAQHEYVEFLIGRNGDFDLLASSVIRRAIRNYSYGNTLFVLVLPYSTAEYRNNEQNYLNYYDEVEICEEASVAHFKSAILIRNRIMVKRSDLVICYVQCKSGGAYQAMQYAEKQNRLVVNLAEY